MRVAIMALVLLAASLSGFAQQGPAQAPSPKTNVSPSVKLPHAPTSSDPDEYIKNFDYAQLAAAVDAMPPSPDRDYFSGVLANRAGHVAESIELLTKVLPHLESSELDRAAVALQSLADNYIKTYRYNDAIQVYEELLHKFAAHLDKVDRQSTEDDYRAALLLRNAPSQTITFDGRTDLPTHRNPVLDSIETNLSINGVEHPWILDTGANFSTVSTSFAAKLGLKLSRDVAQTQGITGAENRAARGPIAGAETGWSDSAQCRAAGPRRQQPKCGDGQDYALSDRRNPRLPGAASAATHHLHQEWTFPRRT